MEAAAHKTTVANTLEDIKNLFIDTPFYAEIA
jgi:hypothetical protein